MNHFDPNEIRTEFNRQHPGHGGAPWVRLDLSTGPVLARRNVGHHSSPIYVVVVDNGIARHWMVTTTRQLKANGSTGIGHELRDAWASLIGYTATEYQQAKATPNAHSEARIQLYERGNVRG